MRIIIACLTLSMTLMATTVFAGPLDDARDSGQVIETPDGYIKADGEVPQEIVALVKDINKRRKQAYTKIATKNGIEVDQVARESYKKRIKQ